MMIMIGDKSFLTLMTTIDYDSPYHHQVSNRLGALGLDETAAAVCMCLWTTGNGEEAFSVINFFFLCKRPTPLFD